MMEPVYPGYLIDGVVYLNLLIVIVNIFRKFGLYYLLTNKLLYTH